MIPSQIVALLILAAGITETPTGLCLNPAVPEARAAWYSFGFLVRRAAAVRLDVSESELDVGIQPVMDYSSPFAPPSARIFLSDSLENGAGYCTLLGDPGRFESLLLFVLGQEDPPDSRFAGPLLGESHGDECSSSCHRCLREFGNMAYHPLLDWRLGFDMVRLALNPEAALDLGSEYWSGLALRTAGPYFAGLGLSHEMLGSLHAGVSAARDEVVILTHPLWDTDLPNLGPAAAEAFAAAEHRGLRPRLQSIFRAVRFPYE